MTIPIIKPEIGHEEIEAVSKVLRSGWITQGPKVAEFEQEFAKYVGARHACAVSNCTTALHLGLLISGVRPGDVVITVSHSYIATANSVRNCQAEPFFVDIDLLGKFGEEGDTLLAVALGHHHVLVLERFLDKLVGVGVIAIVGLE